MDEGYERAQALLSIQHGVYPAHTVRQTVACVQCFSRTVIPLMCHTEFTHIDTLWVRQVISYIRMSWNQTRSIFILANPREFTGQHKLVLTCLQARSV